MGNVLEELSIIKAEIFELKRRIESMEEMFGEEMTEEERKDLEEALEEYKSGETVELKEAERIINDLQGGNKPEGD